MRREYKDKLMTLICAILLFGFSISLFSCARLADIPTSEETEKPTEKATSKPTAGTEDKPTEPVEGGSEDKPTEAPTGTVTQAPSEKPTDTSTSAPTSKPTSAPTEVITEAPTATNTEAPTSAPEKPTDAPTSAPSEDLSEAPSEAPTQAQTEVSTQTPTEPATTAPTEPATEAPTEAPTQAPTEAPTLPTIDTVPRIDIITAEGASIDSKDVYTPSTVTVSNCPEFYQLSDISAGVRLRGNSTAAAAKKPYRIKFDVKQSMLGLNGNNKFKSWVLLADYFDSSMLRTYSTFNMAKILLDGKYFSSDCIPVEVYINGEYNGVYLLCEQTQMNKNRVNIPEKAETDTSPYIGYLLVGQGGRTDEPNSVVINMGMDAVTDREGVTYPLGGGNFSLSGGDYTEEQMAYVTMYLNAVYEVIDQALHHDTYYKLDRYGNLTLKEDFAGTTKEEKQIETINAVFDIDAAVRLCILDEIVKNLDAGTYNMYVDLSPRGDGRLTLGPPWDFDFALGNTGYASTHSATGYYATNYTVSAGMRVNVVYVLFGNLPWFEDMVHDVWVEYYDELLAFANTLPTITKNFSAEYEKDFAYWNRVPMSHHCSVCNSNFKTHAHASAFLHGWLVARLDWLNSIWGNGGGVTATDEVTFDFTDPHTSMYFAGINDATYEYTENGFKFTTNTAYDPYFSLMIGQVAGIPSADELPYLEIEYMMPETNVNAANYPIEVFLCAGDIIHPTAGVSRTEFLGPGDGQVKTVRIDLSQCEYWTGNIYSIRIDFFSVSNAGDSIYIKSVSLKSA